MRRLGDDLPAAIELLTGAARPILDRWFETEVLKATLATDAIIGAFPSHQLARQRLRAAAPRDGRSGRRAGRVGLRRGRHGRPGRRAGQRLPAIWASRSAAKRRSTRILTADGKVTGVIAGRRPQFEAAVVASSVDAHLTFEQLLDPRMLPDEFPRRRSRASTTRRRRRRSTWPWPSRRASPRLPDDRRVGPHHHGTMHIGADARLPRTGLRRRQVRPAERRADAGNHDAHQRRSTRSPRRASTSCRSSCSTRRTKLADGQLGRHQGDVRRSLHRDARPSTRRTCPARSSIARCSARSTWSGPIGLTGGNIMQGAMNAAPAVLLAARRRLGRPSHAGRRACTCAAPPATPAAA